MYGVIFGNKNSLTDLGMILTDAQISAPKPKRITVEVPYRDGEVDVTKALAKNIKYESRTISLEFAFPGNVKSFEKRKSVIYNHIQGKNHKVIIESDPDWYWDCYCTVNKILVSKRLATVKIECEAYPYKYGIKETEIQLSVNKYKTVLCDNDRMELMPYIFTTQPLTITQNGRRIFVPAGKSRPEGLIFAPGNNYLEIATEESAQVVISYRKGSL